MMLGYHTTNAGSTWWSALGAFLFAAGVIVWLCVRRERWQTFLAPVVVAAGSLVVLGSELELF